MKKKLWSYFCVCHRSLEEKKIHTVNLSFFFFCVCAMFNLVLMIQSNFLFFFLFLFEQKMMELFIMPTIRPTIQKLFFNLFQIRNVLQINLIFFDVWINEVWCYCFACFYYYFPVLVVENHYCEFFNEISVEKCLQIFYFIFKLESN